MWRRARPVLLMTIRDLRRRPLRTILVAVLLALVTAVGSAAVAMAVASRQISAGVSTDPWVSATTVLVCGLALGVICLVTAPLHMAAARRNLRQIGLLEAAGGRDGDTTLALVAPAGLTAAVGAVVGAPLGLALASGALWTGGGAASASETLTVVVGAIAIVVVVVAVNLVAALMTAWRVRGASVVDTLHGHVSESGPTGNPRRIGLAVACLAVGGMVLALGLRRVDLVLVAVGTVVTWAGLAALLAIGLTSLLGTARRGPYSLRFALREGARYPMRVVPTTIASATMVALLVAAMAYVGSTHQAALDRYTPMGPPGSGILMRWDPDGSAHEVTEAETEAVYAMVTEAGADGRAVPLHTPDDPLWLSNDRGTVVFEPADEFSLLGGSGVPAALLATDDLIDAWGYDVSIRDALSAETLLVPPGTLPGGSGTAVLTGPGGERTVRVEEILPRGPATALLPRSVATELDAHVVAVLVVGLDPTALEGLGQAAQMDDWTLAIEQGPPELEQAPTQYALLAAAAVVVALLLWLMGALAREEARPDVVTLEAVGARPRFTRWVAAWQAGGAAAIAVIAGIPVGLVGTRLLMPVRDTSLSWEPTSLVIPWLPTLAMLVVVPVVAGLGVAALQPRRPPLVRRLAD
ncbi:FtsX-like permease family protein [Occultella kanbiaonis]|uniref:FtsX-like permease family protein n=1 Tax=Occultella kanbiaonis TaxID=2675754 RepID=UPI002E27BAB0|nr:FtsX-like permease family protein [Occultella kanbiaonis]